MKLVKEEHFKKNISELSEKDIGKSIALEVRVEAIVKDNSPLVLAVTDGFGKINLVSFEKNISRPKQGDCLLVKGDLKKNKRGEIEMSLESFRMLSITETKEFEKKNSEELLRKSKVSDSSFLIESDSLELMREKILKCATEIKKAIIQSRPIIVRHHSDCDGYCAGVAIERAVLATLGQRQSGSSIADWRFFRRLPSKSPYYDYSDLIRDLSGAMQNKEKFGYQNPLIVLLDLGSSSQNLLSIKKARIYGCKIIVIDHHDPGIDEQNNAEVDEFLDVHLNPHFFDFDSNLTAGMLSSEVANAINKDSNIKIFPALSGISDKSLGVEFEKYLSLAKESGYSEEYLKMLSETIDFETYYIGNLESKSIVDDLFGKDDIDKFQKQIVDLIYPELKKLKEDALSSAIANSNFERSNGYELLTLDLDNAQVRQSYPSQGKVIGMLYSNYEHKKNFLGVLGISEDMVIFRLSDSTKSSVPKLLLKLKSKHPHAMINGGGHDKAGTIKFLACKKEEIISFIKGEISK